MSGLILRAAVCSLFRLLNLPTPHLSNPREHHYSLRTRGEENKRRWSGYSWNYLWVMLCCTFEFCMLHIIHIYACVLIFWLYSIKWFTSQVQTFRIYLISAQWWENNGGNKELSFSVRDCVSLHDKFNFICIFFYKFCNFFKPDGMF